MTTSTAPVAPWRQGVTLSTRITRSWTREEIEANDARESRMVFADFTPLDEGKGRRFVAQFENPDEAQLGAAAPVLLASLKAMVGMALRHRHLEDYPQQSRDEILAAQSAIHAAEG